MNCFVKKCSEKKPSSTDRQRSWSEAENYLVVCKADIAGEEHGEPVAPRGHIHAFGQLLQNLEMTGLEVIRQSDVELFFMRLNVNI